jgi:hypothetical protein
VSLTSIADVCNITRNAVASILKEIFEKIVIWKCKSSGGPSEERERNKTRFQSRKSSYCKR